MGKGNYFKLALIITLLVTLNGCVLLKSSATNIEGFYIDLPQAVTGEITGTDIYIIVPYRTDVTSLSPQGNISKKSSISPSFGTAIDFTRPVTFTVTAENGSQTVYTVRVEVAKNHEKDITFFSLGIPGEEVTIDDDEILATVPFRTDVTALLPEIEVAEHASVENELPQNFSTPVSYTVTAQDETKKTYQVVVAVAKNTEKEILSFEAQNPHASGVIEGDKVKITLPYGSQSKKFVPIITISENASISPLSGQEQDFSHPVTYTVIAEDGGQRQFTVEVKVEVRSPAKDIINLNIVIGSNSYKGTISGTTVNVVVPYYADKSRLDVRVEVSPKAKASPTGILDFSKGSRTITVTAEDGTKKNYTVAVKSEAKPQGPITEKEAVFAEFMSRGFVRLSDYQALYEKEFVVGLVYRETFWQMSLRSWANDEFWFTYDCMSIILGPEKAWSSMQYIDRAVAYPGSVFHYTYCSTFLQDGKLIIYVYPQTD